MTFDVVLMPDKTRLLRALGYGMAAVDAQTDAVLDVALEQLMETAAPRWVWRRFPLCDGVQLEGAGLLLPGHDIARHLQGCDACLLLALTLGRGVEQALRSAANGDIAGAVILDMAASQLAEQYANEAERLLRIQTEADGRYLTGRFSPGYGDLPLGLQKDLLRLLDAEKAMGLVANAEGILLPRKSITALLGEAPRPVKGYLAGCDECRLRKTCEKAGKGEGCGNFMD